MKFGIEDSVKEKYLAIPETDKDASDRSGKKNTNKQGQQSNSNPNNQLEGTRRMNKNKTDDKEFEIAERLAKECLSIKRSNIYEDWIRVCWCLSNIDQRLGDAFVEFSRKCTNGKFEEISCRAEWDKSQNRIMERRLGLGTLHKWAKEDNPTKYKEISRDSLSKLMYLSMNKTHTDISRYVFEKYKHEFKCSSIAHGRWYHYKNNRWVQNERGNDLRKKISAEVSQDYTEYSVYCNNKSNEYKGDEPEKENWFRRSQTASDISIQLKKTSFKGSVFTECQELFFDEKFEEELDSNDNLLHFLNGVYDLDKHEFREGYPEDNISLTTGINYIEQPDESDYEKINQVEEFINKILPIERVRRYVLNLLASFLHGSNKDQKFHIWTGVGSNGKSMLIDFFKKTIGDYYGSMSITSLTQGRSGSENASPVLAETRGKRFISLDEAETNDEIKVGFMKQLTGGDEITARKLHCAPITFRPKFKLVLTCNELPSIPAADDGTWRRIRVVEYISKFCDNPTYDPSANKYEFLIDRTIQDKLSDWCEVFMYMLIGYYQKDYRVNGVKEPPEVLRNTASYRSDSDVYSQFVEEYLKEDPNSIIGIEDIFFVFKKFLSDNSIDQKGKSYTRRELSKKLIKIIGKTNSKNKWKGWAISSGDDDEDS